MRRTEEPRTRGRGRRHPRQPTPAPGPTRSRPKGPSTSTHSSPTLVITDEADVLRDEGERYADKPRESGVDVTSVRAAGMVHDFPLLDSLRRP